MLALYFVAFFVLCLVVGGNKNPEALLTAGAVLLILMILKWIF